MSLAQLEHAATFADPLPEQTTLDRLEDLFTARRREIILAKRHRVQMAALTRDAEVEWQASDRCNEIANQLTQVELRKREIEDEIINVARLLVAEADADAEMETT